MATKKTEEKKEEKIYTLEELWKMKFKDQNGTIVMIRKAYGGKPKGRLEFYVPIVKEA